MWVPAIFRRPPAKSVLVSKGRKYTASPLKPDPASLRNQKGDARGGGEAESPAEPDEALMARFIEGDPGAFEVLFQRYSQPIYGYLLRMVGTAAQAEDLTQVTFLSVLRSRDRFRPGALFRPWLYAIATNAARDQHRRRRPEDPIEQAASETTDTLADVDPLQREAVRKALEQLPESQRVPIVLHRYEGLSFAEIAEAVGATETAVKVRAHRGYEKLRELLGHLEAER
jgi:RNA polymerase sigma-70 factor (ECF subfamily)